MTLLPFLHASDRAHAVSNDHFLLNPEEKRTKFFFLLDHRASMAFCRVLQKIRAIAGYLRGIKASITWLGAPQNNLFHRMFKVSLLLAAVSIAVPQAVAVCSPGEIAIGDFGISSAGAVSCVYISYTIMSNPPSPDWDHLEQRMRYYRPTPK